MKRTPTDLRAHLYEVLDHVAKTGRPVSVMRGGVALSIIRDKAAPKTRKVARTLRNLIEGDPDALVHLDWPWDAGREP
jgi:hypothetical protein